MQSTLNQPDAAAWTQLAPLLDDALNELGETDRTVLVLRYFENKSAREIAVTLRMEENAAQKRVARALEKLRTFLKHGVTLTAAILPARWRRIPFRPRRWAGEICDSRCVAKGAAASSLTLTLVKGALKIMAWTKIKTAIVAGGNCVARGGNNHCYCQNNFRTQEMIHGGSSVPIPSFEQHTASSQNCFNSIFTIGKNGPA